MNNRGAKVAQQSLSISDLLIIEPFIAAENAVKDAQTKLTAAENAAADAQSALDAAKKTVEDTKADIEKAKDELAKDQALKDDLDHVDEDASLAAGATVFQAGWTAKNEFATLNAAYARYKAAVDAEAGLKAAAADADAKHADANDVYAAALAKYGEAKDALAAAQTEYDKYYLKAKPAHAQAAAQAAAKAPARKATAKGLAQTGDTSSAAGEVFAIGGFTLVAAGVTLGDRRRKQMQPYALPCTGGTGITTRA